MLEKFREESRVGHQTKTEGKLTVRACVLCPPGYLNTSTQAYTTSAGLQDLLWPNGITPRRTSWKMEFEETGSLPSYSPGNPLSQWALLKHTASKKLSRTSHLDMKGNPRKTYTKVRHLNNQEKQVWGNRDNVGIRRRYQTHNYCTL